MRQELLQEAVSRFHTPLYVYDLDQLYTGVQTIREVLNDKADLCYAMKANTFLTRQMSALADRVEVCSMGEFRICKELEIPPEKILISGVLKKKNELSEILDVYQGDGCYTVESEQQYRYLGEWSSCHKTSIHIFIRLSSGNQFGVDKQSVLRMIRGKKQYPYLVIQGIHYFSGTQKHIKQCVKELQMLDDFLVDLEKRTKIIIPELECGPGLSVSYFKGQEDTRICDLKNIIATAQQMKWGGKLVLEMGRALAADCGCYLTRVEECKCENQKNYAITDGGMHQMHYDGQIRGMYQPNIRLLPEREDTEESWTVCGSLCTVNDVLVQDLKGKALQTGDILVFEKTGAYSAMEGMALFLSHELPAVVTYRETRGWEKVRREQETYGYNMERKVKNGRVIRNIKWNG